MSAGRRRVGWALAAVLLAGLVWPRPAGAHAVLARSSPPARASVAAAPDRVRLWFSERLEPAFSSLSVWSASGAQVDKGDASVSQDDGRQLGVTLRPLDPGTYTVRYRVLSVDGHVVESSFPFTVKAAPAR